MNCKFCFIDYDLTNHPKMGYVCIKCLRQRPKKKSKKLKKYHGYKVVYTDASQLKYSDDAWGIAFYNQNSYKYDSYFEIKTDIVRSTSSNQAEYKAMLFAMEQLSDSVYVHFRTDSHHVYSKLTNKYFSGADPLRKIFDEHPDWIIEEIHSSQNKAHKPSRSALEIQMDRWQRGNALDC